MFDRAKSRASAVALVGAVALALLASFAADGGDAAVPGCGAFKAQSDAQDAFVNAGGSLDHNAGGMDPDGDGVACEGLPAPYKGFATIGYNRKREFFFGVVNMPTGKGGEPPCLYGNKNFPDASRRLNIFRVRGDGDKPLLGRYNAGVEAKPEQAKLIWKVERANLVAGKYYVAFDERVPQTPYGRVECPGFSSRPTLLPRPKDSY
jgi:hypothetical protein